ncbi:DUF3427 domain-containing protein [Timonella senegalensis]|uniref:DUF3427 domain-containing protein n=1 Tax=Timonella senegalensis TaxID=1465825 RepID=UPI0002EAE38A|nr:DEAD/DEAH box helicase [Timonella senegalensis]
MKDFETGFVEDLRFGFVQSDIPSARAANPSLITNEDNDTMLRAIREELKKSKRFTFSVAFISPDAIAMLKQVFLESKIPGTIITSDYLGFNSPGAFRELANLSRHTEIEVRVFRKARSGFHAKGYLFQGAESETAIIGSSNLTPSALLHNKEWNLRFSAMPQGDIVQQIKSAVEHQIEHSVPLTDQWITSYEATYVPRIPAPTPGSSVLPPEAVSVSRINEAFEAALASNDLVPSFASGSTPQDTPLEPLTRTIVPNQMQEEALYEIQKLREAGERKAIVVSATGTGKTILSALDVRQASPKRMLFVVHREQILDRAIYEFQRVLEEPKSRFGKLSGGSRDTDARYVFATVQSLSRPDILASLAPDSFDYVLIDEVHRAAASTYQRILDHFQPRFLLGLTATPERTDSVNIFELFDYNVPYEIRLKQALEEEMLAPFHYYGVTDYVDESGLVIEDEATLNRLVSSERVDHLLSAIEKYGQAGTEVRGLIFCSRREEAHELSRLLNSRFLRGKRLRTRALTGDDSVYDREQVVNQLEEGALDYILTVDVFNEGVDIPSINQVVMLRYTKSSVIFTQQLGRGLRKTAGKDYLVVIDFIGNYKNNYLVPIALFGDRSLNKDSIRRNMIDAEEAGHIAGVSSISFDRISKERIFAALSRSTLDNVRSLKLEISNLQFRLNRVPTLFDFARFDSVDPVVMATAKGNYWNLLVDAKFFDHPLTPREGSILTLLSQELLNGKRPHELVLLRHLLAEQSLQRHELPRFFAGQQLKGTSTMTIESAIRMLNLDFYTQAEKQKYGNSPLIVEDEARISLEQEFTELYASHAEFRAHVDDVIETGLYLARHRYTWSEGFVVGQRYSRKDVCRLLNWVSNQQNIVNGYKLDMATMTCPIFITYHKGDEISSSVLYDEGFIDARSIRWSSKPSRTLKSPEIQKLVGNSYELHVFVKKDDIEGTDFYYLGRGTVHNPEETTQRNKEGKPVPIVEMEVQLVSPVETALYDYFHSAQSVR